MPLLRRLTGVAVGCGLLTYAKCKDTDVYKDTLKLKPTDTPGPRVAIIGAGVGGTSCAYFLRECFQDSVTIDIYEKETVGGRTAIARINGQEFESGASIIHGRNEYLAGFAKKFGLEKKPSSDRLFGLSDGKEIYFTGADTQLRTVMKMMWRYGVDLARSYFFVYVMLEKFKRIYKLQNEGHAFTNVQDLLHACSIDFVRLSHYTLKGAMKDIGFGETFIDEIAMAAVHNNYGQTPYEINGFAGFVALAGIASDLWAVKGGNYLIPQNLIKESKANFIKTEVREVKLLPDGQYEVRHGSMKPKYDIVVLAAPQTERNELKLTNFGKAIDLKSEYQRIVTHFVHGIVNPDFFKFDPKSPFPTEISVTNPRNYFNTLAVNIPVQGSKAEVDPKEMNVWKLFAKRPITDDEFNQIFSKIDAKLYVDWLAYPHFRARERFPSFIVHRNFYYLNAIERAASAMEMSAIAGRNVALLAYNEWKGRTQKIDSEKEIYVGNKGSMIVAQPRLQ